MEIGFLLFYVFPVDVFIGYGSEIHLVEAEKRQRKPRSAEYRDAWNLIWQRARREETGVWDRSGSALGALPLNFGEAVSEQWEAP